MADDSLDDPACDTTADRETEHARRNRLQAELLRKAYDRSRHAAFIDAALRRARTEQDSDESGHQHGGC
jgi:hypothetical protein